MSELVVIGYKDETSANMVLEKLQALERDYLVDLDDAAVLVRNEKGKVKVTTSDSVVATGALSGMFWGTFIGLLFLAPLAGLVWGGLIGGAMGGLANLGIKGDFKDRMASMVKPGNSAILAVIRKSTPDKVLAELAPFGGEVLQTSLSEESEEKLMDALHGKEERKTKAA